LIARTAPIAFVNARLIDPESRYDGPGCVVVAEGVIADVRKTPQLDMGTPDMRVIDCAGAVLAPGLIDLRVKTGEPGAEPKETLKSASRAAAAGGVTSIVVQPDTNPPVDEPAGWCRAGRRWTSRPWSTSCSGAHATSSWCTSIPPARPPAA
jgi:dihydroorotase